MERDEPCLRQKESREGGREQYSHTARRPQAVRPLLPGRQELEDLKPSHEKAGREEHSEESDRLLKNIDLRVILLLS